MSVGYREFDNFANTRESSNGGDSRMGYTRNEALMGISSDVQLFNKNVSVLERKVRLLNTPQDDYRLRREIIELVGDTVQLAKMARTNIDKTKDQARSLSPPERMQFERLVSTFKNSVSKFQQIQQATSDIEQEMLSRARSASLRKQTPDFSPAGGDKGTSDLYQYETADRNFNVQRQAQVQDEDVAALEQRERDMHQLEHDIVDINDIFRDLGTMVHDQGDMIDNIESNVEVTAVRVESGNRQLESAVTYKRCSRKLTCVIVCVVIGILVVIIIAAVILVCTAVPGGVCSRRN